jgi:hypothetical protein
MDMDQLLTACIPPAVAVGTGYALYQVIPAVFNKVREMFGNQFYKTVYVTAGQNKVKFIHLIKFMSKFKAERDCKAVIISTDDGEYEVPLLEIRVTSDKAPEIAMKAHVDNAFNIIYIEISVYKRELFSVSETRIEKFDGFMKQFPSSVSQTPTAKQVTSAKKTESVKQPPASRTLTVSQTPPTSRTLIPYEKKTEPVKEDQPKQIEGSKPLTTPQNSPTVARKTDQPIVDFRDMARKTDQPVVNLRRSRRYPPVDVTGQKDFGNLKSRFRKIGEDAERIHGKGSTQPTGRIDLTHVRPDNSLRRRLSQPASKINLMNVTPGGSKVDQVPNDDSK